MNQLMKGGGQGVNHAVYARMLLLFGLLNVL